MKRKLIVTVGLPRSGKSTWAREQGFPIVNRDSIRLAHHGQAFIAEAEPFITVVEDLMVKSLFEAGMNIVIVDACHVSKRYRNKWKNFVKDVEVVFKHFDTDKATCIERALNNGQDYLVPVIERMSRNFEDLTGEDKLYMEDK